MIFVSFTQKKDDHVFYFTIYLLSFTINPYLSVLTAKIE